MQKKKCEICGAEIIDRSPAGCRKYCDSCTKSAMAMQNQEGSKKRKNVRLTEENSDFLKEIGEKYGLTIGNAANFVISSYRMGKKI